MSYSKYINTFPNAEAYETYKASSDFKRPNVAWIQDENRVVYEGGQEELPESVSIEKYTKLVEFINKLSFYDESYLSQADFKLPEEIKWLGSSITTAISNPAADCYDNIQYISANAFASYIFVEELRFRNLKEIQECAFMYSNVRKISFYDCTSDCIIDERAFEDATELTDLYFYNCDTNFAHIVQDCIVLYGIDTTWYSEPGAIIHIVVNR